jgi:hypothetical protein
MFDRYHKDGDEHFHITQLPHDTADAARLYGEMVAKAEREVANATVDRIGADNEAKLVKVASERNMMNEQQQTRVLFKVNGRLYDIRDVLDARVTDKLRWSIAEAIATKVFVALGGSSPNGSGESRG